MCLQFYYIQYTPKIAPESTNQAQWILLGFMIAIACLLLIANLLMCASAGIWCWLTRRSGRRVAQLKR